jgi:hypothetical protein
MNTFFTYSQPRIIAVVKYRVPVRLSVGGKNTRPLPISIRVGYGCHPQVKNYPRIHTHRVGYSVGIGYPYLNCHP